MRVLLLTLLVVAGTQANFLTDIGDAFKTTFDSLLDQSKQVGTQLLDELKVTGATLASQSLQALMLNVADSLSNKDTTTTAVPQKRQLDSGLQSVEDPNGVIYSHADELKQYMQTALGASNHMEHPENYQQPIQDFLDLIDRVVANHEGTTTVAPVKRQLSNLNLAPLTSLEVVVMSHANELKSYLQTAVAALNGLSSMVDQPQTLTTLKAFLGQVDQVIADHNTSVDAVVAKLAQEVTSLMPASGNKRSLSDSISAIGQGLTQMFQPNAIAVKSLVASMGDILKNAATQLFSSMVASATHLGTDASSVQSLVSEGEAMGVSTLKNTLGNIMQQVLSNMEPHLANLAGELLHQ